MFWKLVGRGLGRMRKRDAASGRGAGTCPPLGRVLLPVPVPVPGSRRHWELGKDRHLTYIKCNDLMHVYIVT